MIKKFYAIIPFLILCDFSFGQNSFSEKIKSECKIMADAMLQKNYSTIIDYTYPKIVEMGGGKTALLKAAKLDCPQKVRHYLGVFLWKEKSSMITHSNLNV